MTTADGIGAPEPFTKNGHKARVEAARDRVVCDECPWFRWMPGADADDMRRATYLHKEATTLR